MNQKDIFLSYCREHSLNETRSIKESLEKFGYSVYFDLSADQDDNYRDALEQRIRSCKHFILVINYKANHKWANDKSSVMGEISIALFYKKHIVPLVINSIQDDYKWPAGIPEKLMHLQIHFHRTDSYYDSSIEKLLTRLKSNEANKLNSILESEKKRLTMEQAMLAADRIAEDIHGRMPFNPQLIIGIGRGGAIFGSLLSYRLGQTRMMAMDRTYEWKKGNRLQRPFFDFDLPPKGYNKILLVAGECHTGETLKGSSIN